MNRGDLYQLRNMAHGASVCGGQGVVNPTKQASLYSLTGSFRGSLFEPWAVVYMPPTYCPLISTVVSGQRDVEGA